MANTHTYLNIKYKDVDQNVPTKETLNYFGFNTGTSFNDIINNAVELGDTQDFKPVLGKVAANSDRTRLSGITFNSFMIQLVCAGTDDGLPTSQHFTSCSLQYDEISLGIVANKTCSFGITKKDNKVCFSLKTGTSSTFDCTTGCPDPLEDTSIANKKYVDDVQNATFTVVDLQ